MSIDIADLLEDLAGLATAAISLLAAYRSLTIGKSLVTHVYRSRAYWLAALMIIFAAFALAGESSSAIATDISNNLFFVFLVALLVFIDSNVAVAREIDFFHKDNLHWHALRIPLLVIVIASSVIVAVISTALAAFTNSLLFDIVAVAYFTLLGVAFSYSGAAMIVVARRTYDRTMKKFVKMLGFAILCYVLFLTLFIPLDAIYPSLGDIVTTFIAIAAAYFFYKAAMSLSFVGRIVKEAA
jgi:hypothetical protein